MSDKRKIFASLRYIVPSDLEYFLEESASQGLLLDDLSQSSLFAMKFSEGKAVKVKYAVDSSGLSKALYMQTILDEGWEYMGNVLNCYVWKKEYEGNDRPRDFTDKRGIGLHCLRLGIAFTVIALILIALYTLMIIELVVELKNGDKSHLLTYCIAMTAQLPLLLYAVWAAVKLYKAAATNLRKKEY